MVTTQVIIAEPMSDGTWRLVTSFEDNYNIVLEHREGDAARQEVVGRIQEIKQKWQEQKRIISLESLLTTGRPNSSKTEPSK
jgi:predicted RND superfamily exporter protein